MTNEQWLEIKKLVESKLSSEDQFIISSDALIERFGLGDNFYDEMIRCAQEDKPKFNINSSYYTPGRPETIFDITFSK